MKKLWVTIGLILNLATNAQPLPENLLNFSPNGQMSYVSDVVEFGEYLVAAVSYTADTNDQTVQNLGKLNVRYLIIDKNTMQLVHNIHYPNRGDTVFYPGNMRIDNGVLNIYYHRMYRHSSSYFWDDIFVRRIDLSGNLIEERQLIHHFATYHYFAFDRFVYERNGLVHLVYNDAFVGRSSVLTQYKAYDSSGTEVAYKRLNPFYTDSFSSLFGEGRSSVLEVDGEFYFTTHLWDSASHPIYGYNMDYIHHYDSSMNIVSYSMARADSSIYTTSYPKISNTYFTPIPHLMDVYDGNYVYGGYGYYSQKPGYTFTSNIICKQRADKFYPEFSNVYIRDSNSFLGYFDGNILKDEQQEFIYNDHYTYPNLGSGPLKYIDVFKYYYLVDQQYMNFTNDLCATSLTRLSITLMDKNFQNRKTFDFVDSNNNIALYGSLTTSSGGGVVFGGACAQGVSQFQSVPYLLVIDSNGYVNSVLGIQNHEEIERLTVYPNPAHDIVHIAGLANHSDLHYRIVDMAGRMIDEGTMTSTNILVEKLNTGIYALLIWDDHHKYETRFIKN